MKIINLLFLIFFSPFFAANSDLSSICLNLDNAEALKNTDISELEKQWKNTIKKLSEIPKKQKRTPARSLMFFEETYVPGYEAMARVYLTGAYSMKKIGDYFNVHYVTVSRAVKKYEQEKTVCTM